MDVLEHTSANFGRISIPALLLTLLLFTFQGKAKAYNFCFLNFSCCE